jgi:hypothetical protein
LYKAASRTDCVFRLGEELFIGTETGLKIRVNIRADALKKMLGSKAEI